MELPEFLNINEPPDPKLYPEFWNLIQDKNFALAVNFLVINEIRKYAPEQLNSDQCRTQLGKIKALQELLDLPKALLVKDEPELSDQDEDI